MIEATSEMESRVVSLLNKMHLQLYSLMVRTVRLIEEILYLEQKSMGESGECSISLRDLNRDARVLSKFSKTSSEYVFPVCGFRVSMPWVKSRHRISKFFSYIIEIFEEASK